MLTIQEMLTKIKNLNRDIDYVYKQLQQMKAQIDGLRATDYSACHVDGGTPSDIADRIYRIEKRRKELIELQKELYDFLETINEVLDNMPDQTYAIVIRQRYLFHENWRDIASMIGVSREWLRKKIHPIAVKEFEEELARVGIVGKTK